MITYINSEKLNEIGNSVVSLASDYDVQINKLFKRLTSVPTVTKEWVGNQANNYFNNISLDKSDFLNVGNQIRNYGKYLIDAAQDIERQIKNNANEETKRKY